MPSVHHDQRFSARVNDLEDIAAAVRARLQAARNKRTSPLANQPSFLAVPQPFSAPDLPVATPSDSESTKTSSTLSLDSMATEDADEKRGAEMSQQELDNDAFEDAEDGTGHADMSHTNRGQGNGSIDDDEANRTRGRSKTLSEELNGQDDSDDNTSEGTANENTEAAIDTNAAKDGAGNETLRDLPPPPPADTESPQEPSTEQQPRRNLFRWLSRTTTQSSDKSSLKSPPLLPSRSRTDTVSSLATLVGFSTSSNVKSDDDAESTTSAAATAAAKKANRNSLKDRFKYVRLREEAGIDLEQDDEAPTPTNSTARTYSTDAVKTMSVLTDGETLSAHKRQRSSSNPVSPVAQPILNEKLAPGTAAGTTVGPSTETTNPVNWDLWQAVVNEGPSAVLRSSPDELSRAITAGIPSAIRGVIWQVLAESKNEALENVYFELKDRGKDGLPKTENKPFKQTPQESARTSRAGSNADALSRNSTGQNLAANGTEHMRSSSVSSARSGKSEKSDKSGKSSTQSAESGDAVASPVTSQDGSLENLAKAQKQALVDEKDRRNSEATAVQKLERAIKRDLGARTSYSKFLMSAGLQDGLFGICKAYALYDEEVGYAQGMNFIAMPLLFNMPEEEAFCLFARLMNKYKLRDLFVQDMPGLHCRLYQFERLLEDHEPAVYCHLRRRSVTAQLYATQWFLTLFAYRFPLQIVLRIYDLVLSEGLESAILKFGLVLMQKNREKLLEMKDMTTLVTFLKERLFDVYIDSAPSASSILESGFFGSTSGIDKEVYRADALVEDACTVKITPETLKAYTAEWEEQNAAEKERLATLEALKVQNTSLSQRVRSLEERAEASDKEQVGLASELVRVKVSNQNLTDENESLRGQVSELQTIIQSQPGEVEEKLKHEMDRIMQRNIEVQNENRALEDGCAEMEAELVQAKLKHAEISEELETMRQTWHNVTSLMSGKSNQ